MKLPDEVRLWLSRRYASQHRQWLANEGEQPWPLDIPLGMPTEAVALRQPEAVRAWAASWRAWHGAGELQWTERRWKVLGTQQLPQTLRLSDATQVAVWTGETERWQRALARRAELTQHWPSLAAIMPRLFDMLADYSAADFLRLNNLLAWLVAHPESGLYPRQLPLAGMDSKWLEPRIALVSTMLVAVRGQPAEADAWTLCGLKRPATLVRLRVLDPALRATIGDLGDLCAPLAMIAHLGWQPTTVLIVENLQTGLALQDLPGTVAIIGLGYAVDLLGNIPWASRAACLYWGDIDTHGLAILHRARSVLPNLVSVMMDDTTLHRFTDLWSNEIAQSAVEALPALTMAEHALYEGLRSNRWGQGVRLEQERIGWDYAWLSLCAAVTQSTAIG